MWLLGIELRTSGITGSALNYWAISPAPCQDIFAYWLISFLVAMVLKWILTLYFTHQGRGIGRCCWPDGRSLEHSLFLLDVSTHSPMCPHYLPATFTRTACAMLLNFQYYEWISFIYKCIRGFDMVMRNRFIESWWVCLYFLHPHFFLTDFNYFYFIFFMCMSVLPECMSVSHRTYRMYVWCSKKPEDGIRSPGTGVKATIRVLGIEFRSSGGVLSAFNCQAIFPACLDRF